MRTHPSHPPWLRACMSLQNSLQEVFSQQNYNCCLLTIGINTVAIFKTSQQSFKIFDSHSRDLHGMPHSFGTCTLLSIEGLENFVSYLQLSCLQTGVVPFEIKGVLISDSQSAQKRRIKFEIIKPPHVRIADLFFNFCCTSQRAMTVNCPCKRMKRHWSNKFVLH